MRRGYILLVIVFGLILSGCVSQVQETSLQTLAPEVISWVIPSPAEGTGLIKGILIGKDGEISVGGTPFLSKNLSYGQTDIPPTISFSSYSDIRAIVNIETGEFYFPNVPPADNYVIAILDGPGKIYIVRENQGEAPIEIKIEAGQIIDLGEIIVERN